jgi:hypothetical protein
VGGALALLQGLPVSVAVEPEAPVSDAAYLEFLQGLAASGTRWVAGQPGLAFELDSVRFRVLHPDTTWAGWAADVNDDSVVLLVEYGAFRALFTGDAGVAVEQALHSRIGRVDSAQGGTPRKPDQHRRRLAGGTVAETGGCVGGYQHVRSPRARGAGAPRRASCGHMAH